MSNPNECIDLSCFDEIIGLSETTCTCYPENDYNASKSCVYLDKAAGLQLRAIESLESCETEENIWLYMDRARTAAIQRLVSDFQARMAERYDVARTTYTGYLGKNQSKYLRSSTRTYVGARIRAGQVTGAYKKITHINTIFEATGVITLNVYNSLNENLYTVNLNTTAGQMHRNTLSTPMILPMWDGRCDDLDYVFIFTYDPNNRPYDNKLSCCGRVYHFDCLHPYYRQRSNKLDGWASYLMAGSIETDDLDFSDLSCTTGDYMNGLQFECTIYCDTTKQLCFEQQDINNIMYLTTAFAVQNAAAEYLCVALITSDKVNRYTMVNTENLEAVRVMHERKYLDRLEWLVKNTDLKNTDCFICKNKFNIRRAIL